MHDEPDCRNWPIEVMVSRHCRGKMPVDSDGPAWAAFHKSFCHERTTARGLAVEVYRGWAFCPVYNGRRKKENFVGAHHLAIDFDSGDERSSLDYLAQQELINWFASFAYTTPSHTPEHPKARVVWVLETPVTDIDRYELLFRAMLAEFPWADQGVKDGLRLFYGSPGCTVWANWSILGEGTVNYLVERYEKEQAHLAAAAPPVIRVRLGETSPRFLQAAAEKLLDNVREAPDGEKHTRLNRTAYVFGGYVAGGYYDENDVRGWLQAIARGLPNVRNLDAAYHTIDAALEDGRKAPLRFEREYAVENVL
jgi:hypothetical protein